jgi:hypothetical protein
MKLWLDSGNNSYVARLGISQLAAVFSDRLQTREDTGQSCERWVAKRLIEVKFNRPYSV